MKTQIRIPADELEVGDRIIKTFGTNGRSSFEVRSIEQDQGWLRVDGYKSVRAGVCGPASATYKHSEMLDVEQGGQDGSVHLTALVVLGAVLPLLASVAYFTAAALGTLVVV